MMKPFPEDVAEKILRFVQAGLAVATMKGKSYSPSAACPWALPAPWWITIASKITSACAVSQWT